MLKTLAIVLAFVTVGCAQQPAKQAYTVDADGNVSAGVRSAMDGTTAPGQQELVGVYLPFPPFAIKGGLLWDGTTFNFGGGSPQRVVVPQAAPCMTETFRTETWTEMVPVQRTRQVPVRSVPIPVPQAAPQCMAPSVGGAPCWECGQGACR